MRRAVIAAIAIVAAACASKPPDPNAEHAQDGFEIAPYGIHETCLKLAVGDRLDWRFESRWPVDFNLHYHEGQAVIMPVTKLASYGDSGIFPVTVAARLLRDVGGRAGGCVVNYRIRPIRNR